MDQLKHCPICNLDLPISEFGICRARRDGKNLYCKACIRIKVAASRRALKEYKSSRKRYTAERVEIVLDLPYEPPSTLLQKMSPVERVRASIRRGPKTQRQIAYETRLRNDEIGDAPAVLLLWNQEIKSEVVDQKRVYFSVDETPVEVPERKDNVPCSFSSLYGLGPVIKGDRKWREAV